MTQVTVSLGDNEEDEEILALDAGTEDKRLYVSVPLDEKGRFENTLMFAQTDAAEFSEINAVSIDETTWMAAVEGKLTIAYGDAKKLCEGFFEAGNITDVVLSDAFVVDDEQALGGYGQSHDAKNYAYQFDYVRTVSDSPVANVSSVFSDGDGYSLPWDYEDITFWVSDNGIEMIRWHSHTTAGEIINDDTGVKNFEEAREIFETMVVTTYADSEELGMDSATVSVEINDIELSLVRVREQNASGRSGIYTPAWVFYGNVKTELKAGVWYDNGSQYPYAKYPVLIISAIDGSIIDPLKGY